MEESNITPYQVMYFRSLVVCVTFACIPLFKKNLSYIAQTPTVLKTVMFRGFINVWSGVFLYKALSWIPYSEAVLLNLLKPVFGSILACIFLREPIFLVQLIALFLSLIAVYVYANPGGYLNSGISREQDFKDGVTPGNPYGICFGIMNGFLAGLGSTLLRKLGKAKVDYELPAFYIGLMGLVFIPMVVVPQQITTTTDYTIAPLGYFYLVMVGLSSSLGQTLVYLAYKYQKASTVLVIGYSQVVFAIFSDLVIFDSHLRWTDYLATTLIFIGAFLIFLNKCRKS